MASERIHRRIERLLDQAEEAMDRLDWVTARSCTEAVLALDSGNNEALAFLEAAERALAISVTNTDSPITQNAGASSSPDQPIFIANDRYVVNKFLGEGGKKKVYLAQDTLLDRQVAFALIKTEGLDEVSRTRITREAQAMGRLGSHPHIVTVFDLGEHEGQPFMVTELMGGGDVDGVIEDAPDHRLALEQAIDIAKETCRGLEFAHSRGIVHRDLKPGNVWLTGDGVAKIGDFGLAVAIDRSRLTSEGMMVGTVSYMPPEQAMGREVTPRADLYSLGAMLYEMVTGRPPFLGDDSVAIIGQHINTPPVAPTWHNGQCPRQLEALILRLLAKDPNERPESASDVLTALEGLDLTLREATVEEAQPLDSLAGGVFVGRHREMGELKSALEDALSGRGRLVTLVGEPGIGKTRISQELATYAGLRGGQVLWGRCYEEQGMPPYWPWVQAIRSYVREREPEQLRSEMGAGAADIAEVVSDVKDRFPDLPSPPQLDSPEQARFRLFDSITAFLKSASQKQPLVLVLDDLHWADQPSLLLLQFLTRELENSRLLLIGTYRDMELNRQHPLAESLGELTRERSFQRVVLRGLSQQDVSRFIEVAAGVIPPASLAEAVHTKTEGNPLFVTEVVRLLVQEGELIKQPGPRDSWTVRIPEGVTEVIGRRLNRLSQRCIETLTIASAIGREFELRQLDPLVDGMSEDRLLEVLEEALSARVIEEMPHLVGRYQFTNALTQEILIGELTLTRRVRLHARIAETLEELYGDQAEAHAAELAHHFGEAHTLLGSDKSGQYSMLAGQKALSAYAHEEAAFQFQRALKAKDGNPMDDDKATALFGLACAQAATLQDHSRSEVVENVKQAFEYYVTAGRVTKAVEIAENAILFSLSGWRSGFVEMIGRALAMVPPSSLEAGRLLAHQVEVIGQEEGNYQASKEALERALAIALREGDHGLEMKTLANASTVKFHNGDYQECIEDGLRAIDLVAYVDDARSEVKARYYVASGLVFSKGDLQGARDHSREMLLVAERLRDRQWLVPALFLNSIVCSLEGDWDGVRTYTNRALELSPEDTRLLHMRSRTEYQSGEFELGSSFLRRLVDSAKFSETWSGLAQGRAAIAVGMAARLTGVAEKFEETQRLAEEVLAASNATPGIREAAKAGLALMAVHRENAQEAQAHFRDLIGRRGTLSENGAMCIDRLLGLLSYTMGDLNQGSMHYEEALVFCSNAGYRPELAWTCCDYADTLLQRDEPGDREKAMFLLEESLAISTELGMGPLMERVLSRRDILKA